ncbi:MAG: DUF1552 domain-containing protein [Myxococcota bacterium]
MSNDIGRRNFLRGLGGVTLGLPFLEALQPRVAKAGGGSPKRFIAFFECNGVEMNRFFPTGNYGPLSAPMLSGTALEPLSGYVDDMLVPRGIHMVPRGFNRDNTPGDDHAKGMVHKLTAQPCADGSLFATGISVDQEIANQLNEGGRPALNLQVGRQNNNQLGYVSYYGAEQPATGENNPWLAYQDFMGMGDDVDPLVLQRLVARRESVIDLVEEDFARLKATSLSADDRAKLDMHLTAVRELEISMGDNGLTACVLPDDRAAELQAINPDTVGSDSEFRTIGRMQMDILALALACGSTRAATLQWGSGAGGPVFTWDGMSHEYNHHKLSHGNTADDNSGSEVAGYQDMLFAIDQWFAGELAYLLDRLAAYTEADGRLLDNCCTVWMNELSDGLGHNFMDLPYVMLGSCGGYFQTGQYIKVTGQDNPMNDIDAPHNMLLTTILNAVGATGAQGGPVENFGAFGQPGEFDVLKA